MPQMTAAPKDTVCIIKQRLIAEKETAQVAVMRLGAEEAATIVSGNWEANAEVVATLRTARQRRDASIRAIVAHVMAHRC